MVDEATRAFRQGRRGCLVFSGGSLSSCGPINKDSFKVPHLPCEKGFIIYELYI